MMQTRLPAALALAALVAAVLGAGCGDKPSGSAGPDMPRFDDPRLVEGRSVWMGTCRACHLLGVAGAPAVTDYANWQPRMQRPLAELAQSPIHGIRGDDGAFRMPPRGGNDRLSDQQVERAVAYMLASVEFFHRNPEHAATP